MGPQPNLRRRHPLHHGIGSPSGAPRRRHRAALLAGLLALTIVAPTGPVEAARSQPSADVATSADARATRDWIVTLEPTAVAPDGVGIASRRYRLDSPTGRTAARGRAQLTERLIGRLEGRRGFRAGQRFGWAMQGFTAELTGPQAAALRSDPAVASVVPNAPASIATDSVPLGVARINGATGVAAGEDVDVDVAVIDTGVGPVGGPPDAPELRIAGGTDCRPRRSGGYPDPGSYTDGHGHGTHVAGTIAARANGVGVVGVAPGARIWAVRVFDSRGAGTTASVICGVEWVTHWLAEHPGSPMAVNMSLRGTDDYHGSHGCDANGHDARDPEHQAICTAVRSGAVFAVAAGNESDDADGYIPGRYDEVVTVGALSDFDGLPGARSTRTHLSGCVAPTDAEHDDSFAAYSNFGSVVDVIAPGTCIRSLVPGTSSRVDTTFMSGTSMATPHVTGALARFLAGHPGSDGVAGRLIAASGLDWLTTTDPWQGDDPDASPLRVVDVAALVSDAPGLRAWARRSIVTVPGGATQRTVHVDLQRLGGLVSPVDLSVPDLPQGVRVVAGGDTSGIGGLRGSLVLGIDGSATDGDHRLRLHAEAGAASGDADLTLRVDRVPPDVTSTRPRVTLGKGRAFDGTATVRVAWTATDAVSGVARTDLERSRGGTWTRVARSTASGTANLPLGTGSSARFRIVARDRAGNTATSPVVSTRLLVRDSSTGRLSWTGSWQTRRESSASGRSVRTARDPGARATLRFTGRAVAVVAPRGPGKGSIDVTIDGVRVATVDLAAPRSQPRRIVFASSALTPGDHVITVRTRRAGTELDAILVLE